MSWCRDICYGQSMTGTKSNNKTPLGVRVEEAIPPNHFLPAFAVISHVGIEVPLQNESPKGVPSSSPTRVPRKQGTARDSGHTRVEEGPMSLKELGSRKHAAHGGETNSF
ncbi:hypothetical protein AMECASPLE_010746 [Ameca splendens]|uniref:Uncharacterized protein n=1 Tax=Ameca splendens TaxID=208324 RepID=A0ABV0YYH8_9TELE